MEPFALAEETGLIQQQLGFITLLSITVLVAIVIRRIRIPYTVALVVVGLALSFLPNFLQFSVSSDLILAILVPPLLFEATLNLKWDILKNDLVPVLLLAVGGTLISTVIVGGIAARVLEIPLVAAIAFGALISATDPVAVIAFFRSLGVSKRLAVLMEGESLFNDGVSIVVFELAIGAAVLGGGSAGLDIGEAVTEFAKVALGGIGIGLVLGYAGSNLILKNVNDPMIETATTVVLAYGSYLVAEELLHLSGILAVVSSGLMVGNIGLRNASPTTRLTLDNFWEFLAYTVNSLVFLLLGHEIEVARFALHLAPIIVAVAAVLFSRAIVIYGLTWVQSRLNAENRIPTPYRHVMYWGGLRGAISMALALTLTGRVIGAEVAQDVQVMTFGVVLFTLLVQGTTLEKLIRRLGLADKPPQQVEQQRRQAVLYAKSAGKKELDRMHKAGILFRDVSEAMEEVYEAEIAHHKASLRRHLQTYPELEQDMYLQAREDVIKAERSAISGAARRGFISDELHHELIEEADKRLAALELIRSNQRWRVETLSIEDEKETEA